MKVTLAYSMIEIEDAPAWLDAVGKYKFKSRKTPEEMRNEKALRKQLGKSTKVIPYKTEERSVMERDEKGRLYFLPGLWPRVQKKLDEHGEVYTVVDNRDPEKKPPIDFEAIKGIEFREGQDKALALIATADCGIIETTVGWGKCHHPDTPIIMYDGSIKKAKDIKVGDFLMGDDSRARRVLTTTVGHGPMYRYKPTHGAEYIFNGAHKLSLLHCVGSTSTEVAGTRYRKGDILDIAIEDWIKLPKWKQANFKAYRVGVDFAECDKPDLDPYFVGAYLGDGTEHHAQITTPDNEILDYCADYARSIGWSCRLENPEGKCTSIRIYEADIHKKKMQAPMLRIRQACGITIHEHGRYITDAYKFGSRETRLQLLAGLLDTDGYLNGTSTFEISTKWPRLAEDIAFVARSLGLEVRDHVSTKGCQTGHVGIYHRITILGHTEWIPTKVPRKQAKGWEVEKHDPTHTGFTIEPIGDGDFYGFSVDGNHRYLLGDFTVTHNSFLISVLCKAFPTLRIVVCTSSLSVVNTLYEYLMKQIPREVGIIGGGKDTAKGKRVIISTLKSLSKIPKDEPDLICCDECHDVGDNDAGHTIMQFYFARKFGFSATPVRNDGTGLAMEAIFGPTILQMSYEASVQAGMVTPMKYTMLPCTWCSDFLKRGQDLPEIVVKRYSYWANVARNKAIARLVSEVWNTTDAQVLVMCATLEHAIQLSQLMPWMVVAHYGNVDEATLRRHLKPDKFPNLDFSKYKMNTKDLERIRMAFGKGTLRGVISTYVFKQGVNVVHLQLLIRADGATSKIASIQIPGRLSRLDEGKEYAYLVDFDDSFTPWAKRRSDSRDKLYQEQGWTKITREELLDDLRTKPGDEPDNAAGLVEAGETGCSGAGAETE